MSQVLGKDLFDDCAARGCASDPTRSFIVTAPAGSGKTTLLIQRILRILAEDDHLVKPDHLVAITFTNAAAEELRVRLLRTLEEANSNTPAIELLNEYDMTMRKLAQRVLDRDAKLGWNLLEIPERLCICTIDSFCKSVLSKYATKTGLGTMPRVSDPETETPEIFCEAARRVLDVKRERRTELECERIQRFMQLYGYNKQMAIQDLSELLNLREQWRDNIMSVGDSPDGDVEFCRKNAQELYTFVMGKLQFSKVVDLFKNEKGCWPTLVRLCCGAAASPKDNFRVDYYDCLRESGVDTDMDNLPQETKHDLLLGWRQLLFTKDGYRKSGGINLRCGFPAKTSFIDMRRLFVTKCEECGACDKYLFDLQEEVVNTAQFSRKDADPDTQEKDWSVDFRSLRAVVGVLPILLNSLQELWVERGVFDFTAVADEAAKTLACMNENSIRHLMVDEFQDSSVRQYHLINAITRNWKKSDGRTLFVVGDPMQSIYRFRQAEVELFVEACKTDQTVLNYPFDAKLVLTSNFRSSSLLVKWFNKTFGGNGGVLGSVEDTTTGAVAYTNAVAARKDNADTCCFAYTINNTGDAVIAEVTGELCVVSLVNKWKKAHMKTTEQCAILVRERKNLGSILMHLRAAGIPYQAVEIDTLNNRQTILDLISLTRALIMDNDEVAWMSLLRTPWCGLSLKQLEQFVPDKKQHDNAEVAGDAAEELLPTVWAKIEKYKDYAIYENTRLKPFWSVLSKARIAAMRMGQFSRLVEQTWHKLGGPLCIDDPADFEGARLYFDLLYEMECEVTVTSNEKLLSRVKNLFAPPSAIPEAKQVQVMTIHKSKGMEFDTVILPALDSLLKKKTPGGNLLSWSSYDGKFICGSGRLVQNVYGKASEMLLYKKVVKLLNKPKEENEDRRLLYVAATRAKNKLYITRIKEPKSDCKHPNNFSDILACAGEDSIGYLKNMEAFNPFKELEELREAGVTASYKERKEAKKNQHKRLSKNWQLEEVFAESHTDAPVDSSIDNDTLGMMHADESGLAEAKSLGKDMSGSTARATGTVVHAWLERMARANSMTPTGELIIAELRQHKVYNNTKLQQAVRKVTEALTATVRDHPELLSQHDDDYCEYALTSVDNDRYKYNIIDRLWRTGDCWTVVDYKTGDLKDKSDDEALLAEKIRLSGYDKQLVNYGELVQKRFGVSPGKVRRYLYFPMMNKLVEIGTDGAITLVNKIAD